MNLEAKLGVGLRCANKGCGSPSGVLNAAPKLLLTIPMLF